MQMKRLLNPALMRVPAVLALLVFGSAARHASAQRFTIPGMRVGGPYKATAAMAGFTTEVQNNIQLQLGVAADLEFTLKIAPVAETITVVGPSDPVFSSSHTGAATAVMREDLAVLPTI